MKMLLTILKKTVLFILSMLCFYTGARAQSWRLKEHITQGNNNNVLSNINKKTYEYNNSALPFDIYSDVYFYNADQTNPNNWTPVERTNYTISNTAPYQPALSENFAYQNGNYATSPTQKVIYTYSTVGQNTQEVRLTQTLQNNVWQDFMRLTIIKNPAGKVISSVSERNSSNSFYPVFNYSANITNNGLIVESIIIQYDWNNGNLELKWKATETFNTNGELLELIEERFNTGTNSYYNFHKAVHTYVNGKRVSSAFYQPVAGNWNLSGTALFNYGATTVTEVHQSMNSQTNLVTNSFKQVRTIHAPSGKNETDEIYHWSNNAWLLMSRQTYTYESSSTVSDKNIIATQVSIQIFPNPTTDYIQIKDFETDQTIPYQIIDTRGRIVQTGSLSNANDPIEILNLEKGNYFLQLDNQRITPVKFTKL